MSQENKKPYSAVYEVSGLAVDTACDNSEELHYKPGFESTGKPRKALSALALNICTEEGDIKHTMDAEAGKIIDESQLQQELRDLEAAGKKDTAEYDLANERLNKSLLLYLASRINHPETPAEQIQGWTDAFTDKSIEIWGRPDKLLSKQLFAEQLVEVAQVEDVFPDKYAEFMDAARDLGLPADLDYTSNGDELGYREKFAEVANQVRDYIARKYGHVFDAMELSRFDDKNMSPEDMACAFEAAIAELAKDDPNWNKWKVIRDEEKSQLNVEGSVFEITVGMKRNEATREEFEALFVHEVLRHAMAATNGARISQELQSGLAGYLSWEEAVGVFYEYSLTGKIPEKIVNRYLDISIALGDFSEDGIRQPRSKLSRFVKAREELRNEVKSDEDKSSEAALGKEVTTHINRIYRGTLGDDEYVGVMTKDYVYLGGFPAVGQYISEQLALGKSIDEVIDYISQGKFNPTTLSNVRYIEENKSKDEQKSPVSGVIDKIR